MWNISSFDDPMPNGGGFMNNTDNLNSPSGGKKDQVRRVQSVVPLVTRQINQCEDEDFKLFGLPVQIACLVGVLRNFEVQSTKASCTIEDHSGSINAILWLENDNDTVSSVPALKEGSYVEVYGSIRNQDGEKIVMILKISPVDDCNVLTHHLLKVIETRLAAEASTKDKSDPSKSMTTSNSTMSFSEMSVNNAPNNTASDGLSPLQDKIFKLLQAVDDAVGLSRDAVLRNFAGGQSREVSSALDFLLDEGHVYTTIDNDHFKATPF